MSKPDGGPAFGGAYDEVFTSPAMHESLAMHKIEARSKGMTLRDYFAAAALQGALKDHANTQAMFEKALEEGISVDQYCARSMYSFADAMLAERAK